MGETFDKVWRQPKVYRRKLHVVFAFPQRGIGEGLSVSVDELVLLQLLVQFQLADQRDRMFEPERVIGNRLDLFSRFQHPALAPGVYDAVVIGCIREERERDFENDRVDIYSGLAVSATIDKAEVTVGVFEELIAVPGERAGRELAFVPVVAPLGIVWIEVEQMIAFEFEQRLGNRQFARADHRVRDVIELRRAVDRAKEAS